MEEFSDDFFKFNFVLDREWLQSNGIPIDRPTLKKLKINTPNDMLNRTHFTSTVEPKSVIFETIPIPNSSNADETQLNSSFEEVQDYTNENQQPGSSNIESTSTSKYFDLLIVEVHNFLFRWLH